MREADGKGTGQATSRGEGETEQGVANQSLGRQGGSQGVRAARHEDGR